MSAAVLMATWTGALPGPGQFLKAPKGRVAYEISSVKLVQQLQAATATGSRVTKLRIVVLRHNPADVPRGATVHEWRWAKRRRRG